MSGEPVIRLEGVSAVLSGRPVLDGVTIEARAGQVTALVGPNGAGKSSVIRAAAGLLKPAAGRALLAGCDVAGMSSRQRAEAAAYLPQERRIAWNLPAVEIAALGAPFLAGDTGLVRARAVLEELEIGHLADRGVAEMSGGERARVLLARMLVAEAPALLADEPIAGLDPDAQLMTAAVLRRRADAGAAVLVSLHDLTLAAQVADRVTVIDAGRLVADDTPMQALAPPVLRAVFGLDAEWVEASVGPVLATRRGA